MVVSNRTFSILCLRLGLREYFIPLVSAIVTWMFWGVKENVTKLLRLIFDTLMYTQMANFDLEGSLN